MSVTYNHNLNFGNDFSHSLDPKENKNIKHFYPKETSIHKITQMHITFRQK